MTNPEDASGGSAGNPKNSRTTLFVRNLSKDTTRDELAKLFVDVGPVKHAIIIHERHGGPSKGFGFVTFALEADAEEAFSRTFEWKGKKLQLDWASEGKKAEQKQKKQSKEQQESAKVHTSDVEEKSPEEQPTPSKAEAVKTDADGTKTEDDETAGDSKGKPFVDWRKRKEDRRKATPEEEEERQRTLILFNLPSDFTEHQLRKRLKKRGGGVISAISRDNESGLVKVVYADAPAANAALKEISGREWGGVTVYARRYHQVAHTPVLRAKNRLIVRNLGFHVKDQELHDAFAAFGPVQEVVIKKGEDGKSKGFGFVQFYCKYDAIKAIEELNSSTALGPKGKNSPIAVDFSLAKDRYEALKQKAAAEPAESGDVEEEKPSEEDESTVKEFKDEDEEEEEGESDDDDDDEEGADEDEEAGSDDNESEDDEEDPKSQGGSVADKGVREGRTLFVRNLLFETDEQTLRKRFNEFGPVRGVKLVKDASGRSRGVGFVEFWEKKTCDVAMEAGEITLEGRVIFVNRAVDKSTATSLRKPSEEEEDGTGAMSERQKRMQKDKRHLYLANEGRVPVDNVPNADKKKRQALEDEKRTKLKSPLFFVSPTRLSVKNLNRKPNETLEAKELKKLFKEAAIRGLREKVVKEGEGDRALFPQGKMPAVRVLKATLFQESKDDLYSKSSGFAFVEMAHHIHALAALRILNNNPEYAWAAAGGKQAMKLPEDTRPRLIVSFAIENAAKVRAQKLREDKSKQSSSNKKQSSSSSKAQSDKTQENGTSVEVEHEEKHLEETNVSTTSKKPKKPAKQQNSDLQNKSQQKEKKTRKAKDISAKDEPDARPKAKKQKRVDEDISNRAFEKKVRKRPATSDTLDEIVAKRSNLFEVADSQKGSKRWFEE